jgi:hypothetical protein
LVNYFNDSLAALARTSRACGLGLAACGRARLSRRELVTAAG